MIITIGLKIFFSYNFSIVFSYPLTIGQIFLVLITLGNFGLCRYFIWNIM